MTAGYGADKKIAVRGVVPIDYTPGGADFRPDLFPGLPACVQSGGVSGACSGILNVVFGRNAWTVDIGGNDEIHGDSGDDTIYGLVGHDVLFGDAQDDDILGGWGNDWISGGTGQDAVLGDDGRIFTSRNSSTGSGGCAGNGTTCYSEPLYGILALLATDPDDKFSNGNVLNEFIYTPGMVHAERERRRPAAVRREQLGRHHLRRLGRRLPARCLGRRRDPGRRGAVAGLRPDPRRHVPAAGQLRDRSAADRLDAAVQRRRHAALRRRLEHLARRAPRARRRVPALRRVRPASHDPLPGRWQRLGVPGLHEQREDLHRHGRTGAGRAAVLHELRRGQRSHHAERLRAHGPERHVPRVRDAHQRRRRRDLRRPG
jgi:hypothetical protein